LIAIICYFIYGTADDIANTTIELTYFNQERGTKASLFCLISENFKNEEILRKTPAMARLLAAFSLEVAVLKGVLP
jgi:hypothetical protein